MTMKWITALCAFVGIVCIVLPLHITMTGICFLLLAAVLLICDFLKKKHAPRAWRIALLALTAAAAAVLISSMAYISAQGRDDELPPNAPEFVVVLGAQIYGDQPSLTLRYRLDRAYEYLLCNPQAKAFVSGGQGADEICTEASVMAEYLQNRGIDDSRIIREERASNTRENLIYSAELAKQAQIDTDSVLVITSDFHQCRAKYIAKTLGMQPYGLASPTRPWILKVNYELREVFAFVKAWYQAN